MSFQIHALAAEPFAALFALSEEELRSRNIRRSVVKASPGTPCRVSLADADVGETVILLNHEHQPAQSPYKASHAIFVRQGAVRAKPAVGTVPEVIRTRLISLRLFDVDHMMIDADVVDGPDIAAAISAAFENAKVSYAHLHYAKPGCFAASATRADAPQP